MDKDLVAQVSGMRRFRQWSPTDGGALSLSQLVSDERSWGREGQGSGHKRLPLGPRCRAADLWVWPWVRCRSWLKRLWKGT